MSWIPEFVMPVWADGYMSGRKSGQWRDYDPHTQERVDRLSKAPFDAGPWETAWILGYFVALAERGELDGTSEADRDPAGR